MPPDSRSAMRDMVIAIDRATRLLGSRSLAEFAEDEQNQWAVFSQIVILGEAAGRIPREEQERIAAIPWSLVIGMRHRLVHGYDSIDWNRVWETVKDDLPALRVLLAAELGEA